MPLLGAFLLQLKTLSHKIVFDHFVFFASKTRHIRTSFSILRTRVSQQCKFVFQCPYYWRVCTTHNIRMRKSLPSRRTVLEFFSKILPDPLHSALIASMIQHHIKEQGVQETCLAIISSHDNELNEKNS